MVRFAHIIFLAAETRSSLFFLSSPHPHSFFFSFSIYTPPPPPFPPHLPSPAAPLSKPGVGRRGVRDSFNEVLPIYQGKKSRTSFYAKLGPEQDRYFMMPFCLALPPGGGASFCMYALTPFLPFLFLYGVQTVNLFDIFGSWPIILTRGEGTPGLFAYDDVLSTEYRV